MNRTPQILWAGLNRRERVLIDGPRITAITSAIRGSPPWERAAIAVMEANELVAFGCRSAVAVETCNAIRRRVEGMERGPQDLYRG